MIDTGKIFALPSKQATQTKNRQQIHQKEGLQEYSIIAQEKLQFMTLTLGRDSRAERRITETQQISDLSINY